TGRCKERRSASSRCSSPPARGLHFGWWIARRTPSFLYLLLGAGTLVRPDMVVFAASTLVALSVLEPRAARGHLLVGGGVLAVFVAAATAFRLWYFHDPFPNTYYLKIAGFPVLRRIAQGAWVTVVFLVQITPFLMVLVISRRRLSE